MKVADVAKSIINGKTSADEIPLVEVWRKGDLYFAENSKLCYVWKNIKTRCHPSIITT
eukprot:UN02252